MEFIPFGKTFYKTVSSLLNSDLKIKSFASNDIQNQNSSKIPSPAAKKWEYLLGTNSYIHRCWSFTGTKRARYELFVAEDWT